MSPPLLISGEGAPAPSGVDVSPVRTLSCKLVPGGALAFHVSAPQSAAWPASKTRDSKLPVAGYGLMCSQSTLTSPASPLVRSLARRAHLGGAEVEAGHVFGDQRSIDVVADLGRGRPFDSEHMRPTDERARQRGLSSWADRAGGRASVKAAVALNAEHRPVRRVVEVHAETDVLVVSAAEGPLELEHASGAIGLGRAGAGPVGVSSPPETVALPPAEGTFQGVICHPSGSPGPPENSSPTVGFRIISPLPVWET